MTPTKRRPTTPASQGPTRTAPDVPIVANPGPRPAAAASVAATDSTQLLGPEGEPIGDAAPPTETRQVVSEGRAATKPARRPGGLYPLPVWPD